MGKSIPNYISPLERVLLNLLLLEKEMLIKMIWIEYLIWRSDGLPINHPTFKLVVDNHKVRNQLHILGSVCLNTEKINPYTTVHYLKYLWSNDNNYK